MTAKTLLLITDGDYYAHVRGVIQRLYFLNWRADHPWQIALLDDDPSRDTALHIAQVNTLPWLILTQERRYEQGHICVVGPVLPFAVSLATVVQCFGETRLARRLAERAGKLPKRREEINWADGFKSPV